MSSSPAAPLPAGRIPSDPSYWTCACGAVLDDDDDVRFIHGAWHYCQGGLTMSRWPDILICMDAYTDTLTSAVITAAETTHPGVWSKAPKRKPMAPHGRAQRIRALTDVILVAQGLLEAEMRDGRDFSKTAPDLSYTLMGQAAGMTRQAAHEAVTRALTGPRTTLRRKPLGYLALGSALLNTDEDQS